ncbi:MAG: hypothetical protein DI586_05865 [Micavibrio aeruginosavorus]|uniref:Toxin co-regulated pilus biosynthesis protein Q C-terminal domain-containing protein n=1 Tax=Micavibrio aeruginosavorus TaxID=349221 RepID=A0A2W5FIM7_9BACT|nr:MAG: hypothetical protein DI586_05865 [Micavibrio aeruginosavorus]
MKKVLTTLVLLLIPASAQAGFSLKDITGKVTSDQPAVSSPAPVSKAPRRVKPMLKPSLEIVNERYVPDDIKAKYKMGDGYFEMTDKKPAAPIIVTRKKTLEIIDGPPPVVPNKGIETAALPPVQEPKAMPEPVPLQSKPALVVEGKPSPPPVPVVPVPVERIDTWRARQGELLKDVLARWADREQTEFIWTAAESPKVSKEFSYVGKFDGAVTRLMAQDAGTLKTKFADDVPEVPAAPLPLADDMRVAEPKPLEQKSWFGTSGASLQAVLHAWAESEGATLVWQSSDNFALPQTYNEKSSFEDAVGQILSQYEKKSVRPVGQLYKNPVSGEKVLVIKTDDAG